MVSNLEKYKSDLKALLIRGDQLVLSLWYADDSNAFSSLGEEKAKVVISRLPVFEKAYQPWYSEAKAVVKQLLPDRLADFARFYERPKNRKDITYETYTIEDAVQRIQITRGSEVILGLGAASPMLRQQVAIVRAAEARLASSLFDIRQLVQADVFDSELDAASHLLKNKFGRAAGALAGVVLERHLGEIVSKHSLTAKGKDPAISALNDALKNGEVIETPQWRFIQHLADIRNLCDHSDKAEPTHQDISDLIAGVAKVIKTVF